MNPRTDAPTHTERPQTITVTDINRTIAQREKQSRFLCDGAEVVFSPKPPTPIKFCNKISNPLLFRNTDDKTI